MHLRLNTFLYALCIIYSTINVYLVCLAVKEDSGVFYHSERKGIRIRYAWCDNGFSPLGLKWMHSLTASLTRHPWINHKWWPVAVYDLLRLFLVALQFDTPQVTNDSEVPMHNGKLCSIAIGPFWEGIIIWLEFQRHTKAL